MNADRIWGGIFGVAVGDALGVPVEFKTRESLKENPVSEMKGYMSWNQPPGTWSDDSSLLFCTIAALLEEYNLERIGNYFVRWYREGFWGAHHEVFDIGGSTKHAIQRIMKGESAKFSGNLFAEDNGNGSLMRILPLVYFLAPEKDMTRRYQIVKEVSSITHAHFRSVFACFIYVEYGLLLLKGINKKTAYQKVKERVLDFAKKMEFNPEEIALFSRVLVQDIESQKEEAIHSSGYVLHSLEASLWCFLQEDTYKKTVLKAVNLGGDTDTTAAIAGGMAGLYYGYDNIPQIWKNQIARYKDIEKLIASFCNRLIVI
ncbi:ADP-ribosylglycohydrolase family protein [Aquimarina sp. TRL1]|uniref:ADP-ribosylglycohydrolase family protein n=1 Tax=Aquimarina sp. (strain TRL1) TaxID=2736252 RepID=UPI00158BADE1|nr:ADP-ribosylglycohydrolase family protein [Aquimarina sp. TRL1]QKX05791.1 ADP-ribosylglycohydrolase family protein [Aquimarina sp. TRL1]